jgi:hypothetical protein
VCNANVEEVLVLVVKINSNEIDIDSTAIQNLEPAVTSCTSMAHPAFEWACTYRGC